MKNIIKINLEATVQSLKNWLKKEWQASSFVRGISGTIAVILAWSIVAKTHAHYSWDREPIESENIVLPTKSFILPPIVFPVPNGMVEFTTLDSFYDKIPPPQTLLNDSPAFEDFIRHDSVRMRENFIHLFTDTQETKHLLLEFMQVHKQRLREKYDIDNISALTPKKIIILAQFITQNIVSFGKDFETLNEESKNGNFVSHIKLWLYNFGNGLIGVNDMLKKTLYENKETHWICHNYTEVFKIVADILLSMQESSQIRENFSCTSTIAAKNPLVRWSLKHIDDHIWNTCYYRTPEYHLQTTIIDVTNTDAIGLKTGANTDFTHERFMNEIALYIEQNPQEKWDTFTKLDAISDQLIEHKKRMGFNGYYTRNLQLIWKLKEWL